MLRTVDVAESVELGMVMAKFDDCVDVGGCGRYPLLCASQRILTQETHLHSLFMLKIALQSCPQIKCRVARQRRNIRAIHPMPLSPVSVVMKTKVRTIHWFSSECCPQQPPFMIAHI